MFLLLYSLKRQSSIWDGKGEVNNKLRSPFYIFFFFYVVSELSFPTGAFHKLLIKIKQ